MTSSPPTGPSPAIAPSAPGSATRRAVEVLAVDGNSLAHRAWHALRASEPDGRLPEGPFVARGMVRMLATAWIEGPYDAVVVCFDGPDNLRKKRFAGYKAGREEKDPELVRQLERAQRVLEACAFTVAQLDGYEADDLLAVVAATCTEADWRCTIVSSDRDLTALVSDVVTLLRPGQSMAQIRTYTPASTEAEYGVPPERYLQLAALRGDPSDGLDGVRGVGAKTAARLINTYGSIATVYAYLAELTPGQRDALVAARDAVERNLDLMAPMTDVDVDVAAAVANGVDLDAVAATLGQLGMRETADHFRHAVQRGPIPPLPPPPVSDDRDHVPAAPPPPGTGPATRVVPVLAEDVEQAPLF